MSDIVAASRMVDIGRIVTVKLDGDATIEVGHYMIAETRPVVINHGRSHSGARGDVQPRGAGKTVAPQPPRIYEVTKVHRQQRGAHPGRYELRARIQADVPSGATSHRIEWQRGIARVL